MTIQEFGGYMAYPTPMVTGSAGSASLLIDAAGEIASAIFQVAKTGTVSHILWGTVTVTTGDDVDARLETLAGGGDPSGTLAGTNSNGTQTVADTDDNTGFRTALTTALAVTKGDFLVVSIANGAGGGDMQIRAFTREEQTFPYTRLFTSSWTDPTDLIPAVSLEYNDGSIEHIFSTEPIESITNLTVNSGTTPDEIALRFTVPWPCRVRGMWLHSDTDGNWVAILYNSASSALLTSNTIDRDYRRTNRHNYGEYEFNSTADLVAGDVYRMAVRPTGGNSIKVRVETIQSAAIMDAMNGGIALYMSERTDAGSWTDTTTERPRIGILISGFDDAVGGGGGDGGMPLIGPGGLIG